MPQQLTFAQAEYAAKKKVTRRERFLQEMEQVLPWSALHALIKPHYYLEEGRGPGHGDPSPLYRIYTTSGDTTCDLRQ